MASRRSVLKINGRLHYLWRAVDKDGEVLDILVQRHRDGKAAKKFFRKLLKGLRYVPRVVITCQLRSYSAAIAKTLPGVEHYQNKMRRFKSGGHAQRFLSALRNHFIALLSGQNICTELVAIAK